jgi:predicted DNA-binding protein
MTEKSTTIRVSVLQRERLRTLAQDGGRSMTETFDAALEALRREDFFRAMADAEIRLQAEPERLATYARERDQWLGADLGGGA